MRLGAAPASEPLRHGFLGSQNGLPRRLQWHLLLAVGTAGIYVVQRRDTFLKRVFLARIPRQMENK